MFPKVQAKDIHTHTHIYIYIRMLGIEFPDPPILFPFTLPLTLTLLNSQARHGFKLIESFSSKYFPTPIQFTKTIIIYYGTNSLHLALLSLQVISDRKYRS
jgi:hypothetical protein